MKGRMNSTQEACMVIESPTPGNMYRQTVRAMDPFLAELGYLEGAPTLE